MRCQSVPRESFWAPGIGVDLPCGLSPASEEFHAPATQEPGRRAGRFDCPLTQVALRGISGNCLKARNRHDHRHVCAGYTRVCEAICRRRPTEASMLKIMLNGKCSFPVPFLVV